MICSFCKKKVLNPCINAYVASACVNFPVVNWFTDRDKLLSFEKFWKDILIKYPSFNNDDSKAIARAAWDAALKQERMRNV